MIQHLQRAEKRAINLEFYTQKKISFKTKGEIRAFSDKQKVGEFTSTPEQPKMLKEVFHRE